MPTASILEHFPTLEDPRMVGAWAQQNRLVLEQERVFGSVARGTSTTDSDLDLLVDMESGRSLFDLMDIQDEVAKIVGHKVDVITENSLNRHIKNQVLKEALPL
jgi:predicted nucleotidyltransferase